MATYYLAEGGTAANKAAATSGTYPTGCMSPAVYNAETFSAADEIHLSDEGGIIRAKLNTPSSGSSGSPIIIKAKSGDSPVVSGATLITGWTLHSGNVWKASRATDPKQVYIDDTFGDEKGSIGACVNEFDWYWDDPTNTIYLYSTSDPDTNYTSPGVEYAAREYCVYVTANYITLEDFDCKYSYAGGVAVWTSVSNFVATRVNTSYTGWTPTGSSVASGFICQNSAGPIAIQECDVSYSGWNGIQTANGYVAQALADVTISDNHVHNTAHNGIDIRCTNSGGTVTGVVIQRNKVHDTLQNGIYCYREANYLCSEFEFLYNLVYDTGWAGIVVNSATSAYHDDLLVYGNTIAGAGQNSWGQGIELKCTNGVIKNNILYENNVSGASATDFKCTDGGGAANSADNNWIYCSIHAVGSLIQWDGTYRSYSEWVANDGQNASGGNSDPVFTDDVGNDYTLAAGSPCISSGANLGASYDDAIRVAATWPTSVTTGDQDDYGPGWEVGAFLYEGDVASTYYMRADGSAANKAAATSDAAANTSMSVAVHNAETFAAGSTIVVSDAGGTYRSTINVPSAGSSGNPIVYQASGSPILSAADVMTGFSAVGGGGSTLLSDTFEDGNMDEWGGTGTKPSADASAAYSGSYGMLCNGTAWNLANKDWGDTSQKVYMSFRFKANSISASGTQECYIMKFGPTGGAWVGEIDFKYVSGTYQLTHYYYKNQFRTAGTAHTIDDGWHLVEFFYESADPTGSYSFWVDGTLVDSESGIDTEDGSNPYDMDYVYLGASGTGTWTTRQLFFDDLLILNDLPAPTAHYEKGSVTTEPKIVVEDGTVLTKGSSATTLDSGEWYWASDTLTVRSSDDEDPDTHTMEVGQRWYCVEFYDGDEYVTLSGIKCVHGNNASLGSIYVAGTASDITIQDCECADGAGAGLFISGSGDSHTISGGSFHDNAANGIYVYQHDSGSGTESLCTGVECYGNGYYGIRHHGSYWTITQSYIHANGTSGAAGAAGIWIGNLFREDGYGLYNLVSYNYVVGQIGQLPDAVGILNDWEADHNDIIYNVVANCDGPGIDVNDAQYVNVYGNTCWGNNEADEGGGGGMGEFRIVADATYDRTSNINLKNNIGLATEDSAYAIYIGPYAAGNSDIVIDNNYWYRESGNWWFRDATPGDNLATWNAFAEVGTDFNDDPSFTDPGNDDFTLASDSPCIDAGTDLGDTYKDGLDVLSSWPSSVVTRDQDNEGSGWEIGAYVFEQPVAIVVQSPTHGHFAESPTIAFSAGEIVIPDSLIALTSDNVIFQYGNDDGINGPRIMTVLLLRG